ncbi:MAG: hypothetical protein H0X17_07445 [Deltaproteobacteria bacterium]|nr:hypothetical protein [Deltaproteobacteria bacterium]
MLIEAGAIDEAALRTALIDQRRWGRPLGRTLVELKLIREDDLVRVLGQQLGLPSVDLDRVSIPTPVTTLVPASLVVQHNIVPFAQPMKFLDVAMLDPTNLGIIDELRIRTRLNIRPYLAGPQMIERAILKYYRGAVGVLPDFSVPGQVAGLSGSRWSPGGGPVAALEHEQPPAPGPGGQHEGVTIGEPPRDGLRPFRHRDAGALSGPPPVVSRDREIDALQERISKLEALVARDENVLRKLLSLLIEKGLATREEIVERLS